MEVRQGLVCRPKASASTESSLRWKAMSCGCFTLARPASTGNPTREQSVNNFAPDNYSWRVRTLLNPQRTSEMLPQ